MRALLLLALCAGCDDPATGGAADLAAATATGDASAGSDGPLASGDGAVVSGRGFPASAPWVSFYGTAQQMGDLTKVASTFRVINLDADPAGGSPNFTPEQISTLQDGGHNRVISYLNLGSCEMFRTYWSSAPVGLLSCSANTKAQLGPYDGYPDEVWMNLGDADYQALMLDVADRLAATGVDGFFLDNFELVEHGTNTTNGPCDAACAQGGLDFIERLRARFPDRLIVMQNATSDVTRLGVTSANTKFPSLLDGISHEEVYAPADVGAQQELAAWKTLGLQPGGRPFFIATEDYVTSCTNTTAAMTVYSQSRAAGFSPYATDASGGQMVVCYWPF